MSFSKMFYWHSLFSFRLYPKNPIEIFAKEVKSSSFQFWSPGDSISPKPMRVLVGVATWSGWDLMFLDEINKIYLRLNGRSNCLLHIDVFAVDNIKDDKLFFEYFPCPLSFTVTPVAGEWNDSVFKHVHSGVEAIKLVRNSLSLAANCESK